MRLTVRSTAERMEVHGVLCSRWEGKDICGNKVTLWVARCLTNCKEIMDELDRAMNPDDYAAEEEATAELFPGPLVAPTPATVKLILEDNDNLLRVLLAAKGYSLDEVLVKPPSESGEVSTPNIPESNLSVPKPDPEG